MNRTSFLINVEPILKLYGDGRTENSDSVTNIEQALLEYLVDQHPKKSVERRTYQRFQVKKDAFALIRPPHIKPIHIQGKSMSEIACAVFRSKFIWVGHINNISLGGLACHYIKKNDPFNDILEMDLLLAGSGFYLKNLAFEPIADFEIDDVIPFDTIETRQLRVQFHLLTEYQKSQLDDFIRDHTTREL